MSTNFFENHHVALNIFNYYKKIKQQHQQEMALLSKRRSKMHKALTPKNRRLGIQVDPLRSIIEGYMGREDTPMDEESFIKFIRETPQESSSCCVIS